LYDVAGRTANAKRTELRIDEDVVVIGNISTTLRNNIKTAPMKANMYTRKINKNSVCDIHRKIIFNERKSSAKTLFIAVLRDENVIIKLN